MEVQNGVSADLIYFADSIVSSYTDGNGDWSRSIYPYDMQLSGEPTIEAYHAVYGENANDVLTGTTNKDAFVAGFGNDTILTFDQGDVVVFEPAGYEGNLDTFGTWGYWDYVDDTLFTLYANEGSVTVVDCYDKTIPVLNEGGKGVVHAYIMGPDSRGAINGDPYTGQFIGIGSSGHSNEIYAGSNGSTLWGGFKDHNDTLIGGSGNDWFVYSGKNGQDVVLDAGKGDVVELKNVGIRGGGIVDNDRSIFVFEDGGSLVVEGQPDMFIVNGVALATDFNDKSLTQLTQGNYQTYNADGTAAHFYNQDSASGRWTNIY